MHVVKPRMNMFVLYRQNREHEFRDKDVRFSENRNLVFLAGVLANPLYRYEMVTTPLVDGTYKFKIKSEDDLGNQNDGVETTGTVTQKLWYPRQFRISAVTGNQATFNWLAPSGGRTPTHYVIYGNGGSGYVINRLSPLATIAYGTLTADITVASGNWLFVIESKDGTGETINNYSIFQTVPLANVIPMNANDPGDQPVYPVDTDYPSIQLRNVQLRNISLGKCEISFNLLNHGNIKYFRIYHDSGTGTINWAAYAYRFDKQATILQKFETDRLFTEDENRDYLFGIRAESNDGVVEGNLIEYPVTIDGKAPNDVEDLSAGAV